MYPAIPFFLFFISVIYFIEVTKNIYNLLIINKIHIFFNIYRIITFLILI